MVKSVLWWRNARPVEAFVRLVRSLALAVMCCALVVPSLILFLLFVIPPFTFIALVVSGPWFTLLRLNSGLQRRVVQRDTGQVVQAYYKPVKEYENPFAGVLRLRDSMVLRDATWVWLNGLVGFVLLIIPFLFVLFGVVGLLVAVKDFNGWIIAASVVGIGVGLVLSPIFLQAQSSIARTALAGGQTARLKRRLKDLKSSRQDVTVMQAAEIARIERDLHDGAQARLVATGMTLSSAQAMLDKDPALASQLLAEAKRSTAQALADMRHVVRGIYPPVLADRGLVEALRAFASSAPTTTTVTSNLVGDLLAPLESALYFAVTEAVTNALKHAEATRITVTVDADETRGQLMITVFDDGRGGVDENAGSGIQGIRRRMRAFDGRVAVDSPQFGPTVVAISVPIVRPNGQ